MKTYRKTSLELIEYYKKKRREAKFGAMILKVCLDKMRERDKSGEIIPDIVQIGPVNFIEKEYGLDHRFLPKILKKIGPHFKIERIEGKRGYYITITRQQIETIIELYNLWLQFVKLPKHDRQLVYFSILYLGRIS